MSYDLRRNVILELRLQVCRSKYIRLKNETEQLCDMLIHGIEGVELHERFMEQAKRAQEVLNELENTAPNLHS
jgi:hypothetical protein